MAIITFLIETSMAGWQHLQVENHHFKDREREKMCGIRRHCRSKRRSSKEIVALKKKKKGDLFGIHLEVIFQGVNFLAAYMSFPRLLQQITTSKVA